MTYNSKYLVENKLCQLRPKQTAINTYFTDEGIVIGMFQGKRGQFPQIDFVVKILKPGESEVPFPPIHSLWVVDLLLKIPNHENDVKEIIDYYLKFYSNVMPFQTAESRSNYELKTVPYMKEKYSHIEQDYTLSIGYVATIIELFCLCEKRNAGAYMFRDLLQIIRDYCNGNADYISVIRACQPGFR